jgi:beta-D-xylosidase 4
VARDNWHFDGYITSDCDADAGVFGSHHYTATAEETVRDVLQAGVDVDCGTFVQSTAASALNQSLINETLIETRIANLFRVRFRLGHFDPPGESETNARLPFMCARTFLVSKHNKSSFTETGSGQRSKPKTLFSGPLDQIPRSVVANDYATRLSLDGAAQSSVLLKNSNQTLPWDRDKVGTVAVIGANSETAKLVSRCGLLMETDRLSRQARDSHNQDEGNLSGC